MKSISITLVPQTCVPRPDFNSLLDRQSWEVFGRSRNVIETQATSVVHHPRWNEGPDQKGGQGQRTGNQVQAGRQRAGLAFQPANNGWADEPGQIRGRIDQRDTGGGAYTTQKRRG